MITDLEGPEEPGGPDGPAGPGAMADVVGVEGVEGRGRDRWLWGAGTAVVTSALWLLVLQGGGTPHSPVPDLHGYHVSPGLCAGGVLAPLTEAMRADGARSAVLGTTSGEALDQARCDLRAAAPNGVGWMAVYDVTITVELHRKTDPGPEFEDRNRRGGPDLGFLGVAPASGENDRVTPVPNLGDAAYLLTGDSQEQALTVLHGGAVLTLDVLATGQWVGAGNQPPNSTGPQHPPSLTGLHPAMAATMRNLMGALAS